MGTVVSISTIVAHQRSGDAGRHQRRERLPASSEVPGGSLDVLQSSDCGLHQERGGHEIAHFDAADHTTAEVVRPQGDYVGSSPSARSAQHPGGFSVQSRPDTDHGVDDGHGAFTNRVCQVGRDAGRLVCDFRQQTAHQVRIAVSGPQGRVDTCHVHALGGREGPPVRVPAIQDGPSSTVDLFATFANRRLIKFVWRYPAPGQSGQMPCPCLGATGGASCTRSCHLRWSLKYCRRSLSHQEWRWFWSLNCNWQRRGFQSRWISPKKIRSRCTSGVKTCWHKTFGRETGWPRLITSDRQIYTGGNSAGHPEGEGPFQGSCQHDVKVPSGIFTASVRIPLVKIRGVL